ncbi:hypothetical protein J8I29_02175 [Labrys sp. LIt4]|uniref:Uncharacterized protein n=1 Tax=Labrys okinawensis TaxID=346911 RepID=A0A2S9QEU2_9HYPH|nr:MULTISPECIES: hypothetical protein [Labrys]MBP0578103.1 hypothetical protein [Labrys sp. LIt4]PRH87867.1 hypothetical protein C5L14_08125 [Labrys okinawensis]
MTTLRWVRIRQNARAELWKLDKPLPGGGVATFYRGRLFEQKGGERVKQDEEAKFTEAEPALAWFERQLDS